MTRGLGLLHGGARRSAGAAVAAGSGWDLTFPQDASGHTNLFTFSPDALSVTLANNDWSARGTVKKATGKWYFEQTLVAQASDTNFICGIIPDTATGLIRVYECGDHFTFESWASGQLFALSYNGANQATLLASGLAIPAPGDVYGFCIDLDTPLVRIIFKGVTYPSPYLPIAGHFYRPSAATGQAATASPTFKLNTGGPFFNTKPAGFTAWG